jgi:hypothetical protein
MQHKIRRAATVAVATGGAIALFTGTAAAHYCTNESLKGKAGEAYALFSMNEEVEEPLVVSGLRLKGDLIVGGGFVDLYVDANDTGVLDAGDFQLADNMFLHAGLPVSALKAAGCGQRVGTAFPEFFELPGLPVAARSRDSSTTDAPVAPSSERRGVGQQQADAPAGPARTTAARHQPPAPTRGGCPCRSARSGRPRSPRQPRTTASCWKPRMNARTRTWSRAST